MKALGRSETTSWDSTAGVAAAPGQVEVIRRFLNTVNVVYETDELGTARDARRWLLAQGLLRRREQVSEEERLRLVELREAVRALASSYEGERLPRRLLVRLNRLGAEVAIGVRFSADGDVQLAAAKGDVRDARSILVAIVAESIRDGSWSRLKTCHDDACGWAFYDASRNRVGTWCSMAYCGNRAKTRAFRRRQRAAT